MPLMPAIWILEQEYKFAQKYLPEYFSWGPRGIPTIERDPYWFLAGAAAAAVQTAVITAMPYAGLLRAHGFAADYVWMRTAPQHAIRGFKGITPYGWSVGRKAAFRLGAAKVAVRFIPYVGWGLLAYDLYTVGKWAAGHVKAGAFRVPD